MLSVIQWSWLKPISGYITYSNLIKPFIKQHVVSLLQSGVTVVMDFPANTVKQRSWFLRVCAEAECPHEMHYLDISDAQCLAQIGQRRKQQPERAQFDTEAMFRLVSGYFEAPALDEELNIVISGNGILKDSDE
jgi:thymidylate kinase